MTDTDKDIVKHYLIIVLLLYSKGYQDIGFQLVNMNKK